jgi:ADP-heptose:LPS heptosyltransferase
VQLATRLPYSFHAQARHVVAAAAYRMLSWVLRPVFRGDVGLGQLKTGRILILKPCCLGDVVFATPLVRELRRALPDVRLTFGVGRHSLPAIAGNPDVDEILDTGAVGNGPYRLRDLVALCRAIHQQEFDACFVLERSAILNAVPLMAGISLRIGIDSGGRGFTLTRSVNAHPRRPESELYLDLLRAIGGQPNSGLLRYDPGDRERATVATIVRDRIPPSTPWVVVHGAGGVNPGMVLTRKRWPTYLYRDLVKRITAAGAVAVLVGAKEDRELVDSAIARDPASVQKGTDEPNVVNLVGQLELGEVAALAQLATAYVGNDSGPTHLAEAAGARAIMLFGPSDPIVYGPRSPSSVALTAGVWCSPCFEDGRFPPCANVICMQNLSVDRVWRELAPLLETASARR